VCNTASVTYPGPGKDQAASVLSWVKYNMEEISEVENDDYEEFTVVEDTVITQGQCPEDFAEIVVTWGRLRLKLIDSRTSFSDQNENIETKKSKETSRHMPGGHGEIVKEKNYKNSKSKKKFLSPILPCIIKEPEEDHEEGWTKIPVDSSSVVIEEIDEYEEEEIFMHDDNSRNIAPIVDEVEESGENMHHNKTTYEEVFDIIEHEEDDQECESADEEKEIFETKSNQIHLGFVRSLEEQDEGCEELVLTQPQIIPVSTSLEIKYLFTPFIEDSITVCQDEHESEILNNPTMRSESLVQENKEAQEKLNSTSQFCKIQETPTQGDSSNKQEIYFFTFLMFFILLIIFHTSSSSSQSFSCFGEDNEERGTSCALEGFVELSRM